MPVFAIISFVRAYPVETVEFLLDCFQEMFTSDNSVRSALNLFSGVGVNIYVSCLGLLGGQGMTVFAPLTLLAHS